MIDQIWKSLLVEFVGTFTLVFVGGSAVALSTNDAGGNILVTALAFGLILAALIYAWGSISGMHVNPAVSFGFACAGRLDWKLMLGYWVAQVLGGIAAAALLVYFYGAAAADVTGSLTTDSTTSSDTWKAVLLEAVLTFFLVVTILMVTKNASLAMANGVAIGAVLSAAMMGAIPLTGGSLNPARSLGPEMFNHSLSKSWIYIVGPMIGALLAAVVYRVVEADWSCHSFTDEDGNVHKVCNRVSLDAQGKPLRDPMTGAVLMQQEIIDPINAGYKQVDNEA